MHWKGHIMVIKPDHSKHYKWGSDCDGWHLLNTELLSVIKERVPKGGVEEMHFHRKAQQLFFVLQGVATIQLGEETYRVPRGEAMHVPPKTPHRLENTGEEELIFLVISQPHSHTDKITL